MPTLTSDRRQSSHYLQLKNKDQKSLETVVSNAICRQSGDKWQSKTLFLMILSTFLDSINIFNCRLLGMRYNLSNIHMIRPHVNYMAISIWRDLLKNITPILIIGLQIERK